MTDALQNFGGRLAPSGSAPSLIRRLGRLETRCVSLVSGRARAPLPGAAQRSCMRPGIHLRAADF